MPEISVQALRTATASLARDRCDDVHMPVDRRFSAESFMSLEPGSEPMRSLLGALEGGIVDDIRATMQAELQRIVADLNSLGHRLVLYELSATGIDYHDVTDPLGDAHCRLRLGVDFVVSAGYGGVSTV